MITTTHIPPKPSTSSITPRVQPEPVKTGNLYGRVITYAPGVLCLTASTLGLLSTDSGSLFIMFGMSTGVSGYFIYLSHSYRNLQAFAESNRKLQESITKLEEKIQNLKDQLSELGEHNTQLRASLTKYEQMLEENKETNAKLQASATKFEGLFNKNKEANEEHKKQIETLKGQIETLEMTKKTISEEASRLVERIQGIQSATEKVLSAAKNNQEEFGERVGEFYESVKKLTTFQSTSESAFQEHVTSLEQTASSMGETLQILNGWIHWKKEIEEGITTLLAHQKLSREIQQQEEEKYKVLSEKTRQEQEILIKIREESATERGKLQLTRQALEECSKQLQETQSQIKQEVAGFATQNSRLERIADKLQQK